MSDLNRIKQAMADGEHTDGDLEWCVDEIERLTADLNESERQTRAQLKRVVDRDRYLEGLQSKLDAVLAALED